MLWTWIFVVFVNWKYSIKSKILYVWGLLLQSIIIALPESPTTIPIFQVFFFFFLMELLQSIHPAGRASEYTCVVFRFMSGWGSEWDQSSTYLPGNKPCTLCTKDLRWALLESGCLLHCPKAPCSICRKAEDRLHLLWSSWWMLQMYSSRTMEN